MKQEITMAIKGTPERSYHDDLERRTFWTVEALKRWAADCEKRRARYMGKTLRWYGKDYPVVDVVFTEHGLIGWVLYRDGDQMRKIAEGHSMLEIS